MVKEFVHCHVHSDYSILDASISVPVLVAEAKAKGMKSLALTDHGNVHGVVQFYTECKKQGIKPILGCEIYVARKSALEKMDRLTNPTDHLVLLARNKEGYENILRLVSWAYQNGMHYVGRVDLERLRAHGKGIIAQSACLSGGVNRLLRGWEYGKDSTRIPPNYAEARKLASDLRDIFGPDGFFLEVQHHHGKHENPELLVKQRELAEQSFKLAQELGIPMVATNDIHFRGPNDAAAREMAYMIARGKVEGGDFDRVNHAAEFYVKNPEEMFEAFQGWPTTPLENTLWIAEQCNVELELDKNHFAHPIDEMGEMTPERVQETWKRWLYEGFSVRYGEHYPNRQAAWERVLYEQATIEKMGFVPYFLVVTDFIRYAKGHGIPVGPGRGSVGGSAVAYCLGITDIDPIEYDLLFERFLNPERISMPDIDVDFDKDRVHEVLDYIVRKYGRDRVARISAFGKMWAKAALNDVGRILQIPMEEVRAVTAELPDAAGEFRMSIEDAIEQVEEVRALANSVDPNKRMLIEFASKLEGIKRTVTSHACGIVIGDESLELHSALMPVKDDDFGGILQSQLDMASLEKLGLLKYDFLALDTLTIIARAEKHIRVRHDASFKVSADRSRKDQNTFSMLSQGRTVGAFQIENPGMRELTMLVQPKTIEDVSMILALYRPGPLDAKDDKGLTMVDHYVLRRAGHEEVSYLHPSMEPVLKVSHGILVYQEQIMRIAQYLCGYSLAQADNLRKGIGKKLPEIVKKEREKFIPAAIKHSGISQELAETIWHQIETFARYGFNKSLTSGTKVITDKGLCQIEKCHNARILTMGESGLEWAQVIAVYDHGELEVQEVTFDDGSQVCCTFDHKFLTEYGQLPLWQIVEEGLSVWGCASDFATGLAAQENLPDCSRSSEGQSLGGEREGTFESAESAIPFAKEGSGSMAPPAPGGERVCSQLSYREERQERKARRVEQNARSEEKIIGRSEENSSAAGDHREAFGESRKVAHGESREVCRDPEASSRFSKAVESGNLSGSSSRRVGPEEKPDHSNGRMDKASRLRFFRTPIDTRDRRPAPLLADMGRRTTEWNKGTRSETRETSSGRRVDSSSSITRPVSPEDRATELRRASSNRESNRSAETFRVMCRRVVRVHSIGTRHTYDLEINHPRHNFLLANGICTSNSHSVAYAVVTYQTMYLKTHYPVEYLASCLSAACGYTDPESRDAVPKKSKKDEKVKRLIDEANRMGISVLAPNVNLSDEECLPEGERSIRMGFCSVKGLGQDGGRIISARSQAGGRFKSFTQMVTFCRASKVNNGALQVLIECGACDSLGERNQMLASIEGTAAAAKESMKMGAGVPSFIDVPEQMPQVYTMDEEQMRSLTLDLVGAYEVKPTPPSKIVGLAIGPEAITKVAQLAEANPGTTPLHIAYSPDEKRTFTAFLTFGNVSNDEGFLQEIQKHLVLGVS